MVCSTWQSDRSLSGYGKKLFLGSVSQNDGSVARTLRFWFLVRFSGFLVGRCFLDLVLRMAEASRETLRFWFLVRFSGLGRKVFLGSGSQNDGSVARNAPFLVSSTIFWFWSERVSWRSATRNTLFQVFFPLGTL